MSLDGDDLVVTWELAGDAYDVPADDEGGFWDLSIGKDSVYEYQAAVKTIDGELITSVFDFEAGRNDPDSGSAVIDGNRVTLRVPTSAVGGVGSGWVWQAGSEAGYSPTHADSCPATGSQPL